MKVEETFVVDSSADRVWAFIMDPAKVTPVPTMTRRNGLSEVENILLAPKPRCACHPRASLATGV